MTTLPSQSPWVLLENLRFLQAFPGLPQSLLISHRKPTRAVTKRGLSRQQPHGDTFSLAEVIASWCVNSIRAQAAAEIQGRVGDPEKGRLSMLSFFLLLCHHKPPVQSASQSLTGCNDKKTPQLTTSTSKRSARRTSTRQTQREGTQ